MTQADSNLPPENDPPSEDASQAENAEVTDAGSKDTEASANATSKPSDDLSDLVEQKSPGIVAEFVDFILHNKRWWLTPIIIVLLLIGILVILGSSSFAPFIYTVF